MKLIQETTHLHLWTKAYVLYTTSDLYVGFIASANMDTLRSSIRNRDEGFRDDNVLLVLTMETVVI